MRQEYYIGKSLALVISIPLLLVLINYYGVGEKLIFWFLVSLPTPTWRIKRHPSHPSKEVIWNRKCYLTCLRAQYFSIPISNHRLVEITWGWSFHITEKFIYFFFALFLESLGSVVLNSAHFHCSAFLSQILLFSRYVGAR